MRRVMVLASVLLLAGCGGSDDDHHQDNGPPPVVPLTTGEYRPPSGGAAIAATIQFDTDGTNFGNRFAGVGTPNFGIVFDQNVQRYVVGDSAASATFGAPDLVEETSGEDAHVFFRTRRDNVLDYLTIYKTPSNTSASAEYGTIGAWQDDTVINFVTHSRTDWFGYGSPTPATAVPTSGTGYYNVQGRGTVVLVDKVSALQLASSRLRVDFGRGEISGSIIIANSGPGSGNSPGGSFNDPQTGPSNPSNPPDIFGRTVFRLQGTLKGNVATGTVTGTSGSNGHFNLVFLGPTAQNLTLVASSRNASAAFAGAEIGVLSLPPAS